MIDMNKKYRTRDGQEVRILCTDAFGNRLVVALVGANNHVVYFDINGKYRKYMKGE